MIFIGRKSMILLITKDKLPTPLFKGLDEKIAKI